MIRNGRSFFISVAIHGVIAVLVLLAIQVTVKPEKPKPEKLLCIDLKTYASTSPTLSKPVKPTVPKPKVTAEPTPVTVKQPVKPSKTVEIEEAPEPESVQTVTATVPDVIEKDPVKDVMPCPPVHNMAETIQKSVTSSVLTAVQNVPKITPEQRYFEQHVAEISRLLQANLYYPRMARKRGITGEVIVAFELLQSGEARGIVVRSGDRTILNKAAIETIERLSGEFPKPEQPLTLNVPIRYQLQ
jgi:protein TonB